MCDPFRVVPLSPSMQRCATPPGSSIAVNISTTPAHAPHPAQDRRGRNEQPGGYDNAVGPWGGGGDQGGAGVKNKQALRFHQGMQSCAYGEEIREKDDTS